MATYSSILAWEILWKEEPGGLQSMWSQRVRHDWGNLAHTHTHTHVNPNLPIYPSPSFPIGNHKFVFYICNSIFSVLKISPFVSFFKIPHISDIIYLSLFVRLISFSMTISRSVHVPFQTSFSFGVSSGLTPIVHGFGVWDRPRAHWPCPLTLQESQNMTQRKQAVDLPLGRMWWVLHISASVHPWELLLLYAQHKASSLFFWSPLIWRVTPLPILCFTQEGRWVQLGYKFISWPETPRHPEL